MPIHERIQHNGSGDRLAGFAGTVIFGGRMRIWSTVRTMAETGEFFDLEASQVGRVLGMPWGKPTRVWLYVF